MQGLEFKFCGWKNMVGKGDPIKCDQPNSSAEISHQQKNSRYFEEKYIKSP
jgi:hypothetical protein